MSSMKTFKSSDQKHKISMVLAKLGFECGSQIAKSLQGEIWRATYSNQLTLSNTPQTAVIKIANKILHKNSNALVNGTIYQVHENIVKEQGILKFLSAQKNFPKSITKFKKFVESNTNYYFVQEDGGSSLFEFIVQAHELIAAGQIEISHWQFVVKIILKQMIEAIEFIHLFNTTHNDISLENFLINDVEIEVFPPSKNKSNKPKVTFVTDNIQIKLCDFGLSEMFTNSNCKSDKYVGKTPYKSPEVINKTVYNAKKNDLWCFGVCAFMMVVGKPPFRAAKLTDKVFTYIMDGFIIDVLKSWNVMHFFDQELLHIIDGTFQYEKNRIGLDKIKILLCDV